MGQGLLSRGPVPGFGTGYSVVIMMTVPLRLTFRTVRLFLALTGTLSCAISYAGYQSVKVRMTAQRNHSQTRRRVSMEQSQGLRWQARLKELCVTLRDSVDEFARDQVRTEAWLLLNSAIMRYLRYHVTRFGQVGSEDLQDIASQKSLDLMCRAESGSWDISRRLPSEIAGFLSTVARNGLVDVLRKSGRYVEHQQEDRTDLDRDGVQPRQVVHSSDPPDLHLQRREFAMALRRCADKLDPRSRLVWFFRVFYDMSSKQIGGHPEIRLKASHVDVLLQRARHAIAKCMQGQGFDRYDIPPGTFVALWKAFRLEQS